MNLKSRRELLASLSWIGLVAAGIMVAVGTFWSFQRGANDFSVFYEAWKLVLHGKGSWIYQSTPDRFLYAPGFAWLLSPLALFPKNLALAFWCLLKAAAIGLVVKAVSVRLSFPNEMKKISPWALILLARPLLIDFQYGQVNIFILAACVWALVPRFDHSMSSFRDCVRWVSLSIAAFTKIFPLPLLIIPWLVTSSIDPKRLKFERMGVLLGTAIIFMIPMVSEGLGGTWSLLFQWKQALASRGLPIESHNQSFAALLFHYFSGQSTHVISNDIRPMFFGEAWLTIRTIKMLTSAWTFCTLGFGLAWMMRGPSTTPSTQWGVIAISLLIVPSHLIWKPYILMGTPTAILVLNRTAFEFLSSKSKLRLIFLLFIFLLINFSGFDFIGQTWAGRLEAASILLLMHLALLTLAIV